MSDRTFYVLVTVAVAVVSYLMVKQALPAAAPATSQAGTGSSTATNITLDGIGPRLTVPWSFAGGDDQ